MRSDLGGAISASPVLAGETIVSVDESGNAHLFKASRKFELLGTSSLSDRVLASPALAGDCIFLRGMNYLYCLDGQTVGPPVVANLPATPRAYQKVEQPVAIKARPPQVPLPAPRDDDIPWWFWIAAAILGFLTLLALMVIVALLLSDRMRPGQNAPVGRGKDPKTAKQDPPTLIVIACAGCAKKLKVKRQLAGKKVKCPQCGKAVLIAGGPANAIKRIS